MFHTFRRLRFFRLSRFSGALEIFRHALLLHAPAPSVARPSIVRIRIFPPPSRRAWMRFLEEIPLRAAAARPTSDIGMFDLHWEFNQSPSGKGIFLSQILSY